MAVYSVCALGLGAVLQSIGSIRSVCLGFRSGLKTISQYTVSLLWAYERSYNQLAVYDTCALVLEAVKQTNGSIRSVCFGFRSGLTTYLQYKVRVPLAYERSHNLLPAYGLCALGL